MSILSDAWRRSRGEEDAVSRALGAPPLPRGSRRGRILPWAVCAVLIIVVVGLGVYVWRSETVRHPASAVQPQSVQNEAMPNPPTTVIGGAKRSVMNEPHKQMIAKAVKTMTREPGVTGGVQTDDTRRSESQRSHRQAVSARATQTVPDAVRAALPPLTVTVHVWNPRPSARFIIVDGHVYHEGDALGPRLRLVAITESGQIVNFRGYLITLTGQ